jgi:NAD(P)-dependent dehydrogenase (short-subunit alcohol dehydrogenase family)
MGDLNGKVWFVTGASAGFGRALCERVIHRGGRVMATARNPASLKDLVDHAPDRVAAVILNVVDSQQIAAAVAAATARFGGIDVLVNCAGYGFLSSVEEASDAEIRAQFDVNVFGLINVIREVLPAMRAQRSGKIVNFSSIAGARGFPGSGVYCASKWAVEGVSESLAAELQPFGIGVLSSNPVPFARNLPADRSLRPRILSPTTPPRPPYAPGRRPWTAVSRAILCAVPTPSSIPCCRPRPRCV